MKSGLPLAVSLLLLAAVVYFSDSRLVLNAFLSANPLYVLLGLSLWAVGAAIRITRWKMLLGHAGIRIMFSRLAPAFFSGFYLSNISPGKAGDPIRAVVFKRQHGSSFSNVLPSIIVERIEDLMAMMLIAMVGVLFLPPVVSRVYVYTIVLVFAAVVGAILFILSSGRRTERFVKLLHRTFSFIPRVRALEGRIEDASHRLTESFNSYKDLGLLTKTSIMTGVLWLLEGVIAWLAFKAVGADVPYIWVLIMVPIATLAGVLSLLPGGIGASEAVGVIFFVTVLNMNPSSAAAASLLARGMSYWMYILAGSVSLAKMKRL